MRDLITPKVAAKMLGVSTNCVRQWEIDGKITAIKTLGGQRRYDLKEIEALLKQKSSS